MVKGEKSFGKRKPFTPKRKSQGQHRTITKGSIFSAPKNKQNAAIVKINTPENARKSVVNLNKKFVGHIKTFKSNPNENSRKAMKAIKGAMDVGEKRAWSQLQRENLSVNERFEMRKVAEIYGDGLGKLNVPALPKKKK